jgi:hemin uptake protein HemP
MHDKVTFLKFTAGTAVPREIQGKGVARIASEDLFDGSDEVVLEHNGKYYLLRKKPLGGLVLTGLDDPGT